MTEQGRREQLALTGARIVDPGQHLDAVGWLLIREGRIVAHGTDADTLAARVAESDAPLRTVELPASWVLAPGFVDLHAHLREPGFEGKETIASGARAAARGGFTTICCMPNTNPVIDSRATLDYVLARAKDAPAHVRPIAAISKGEDGSRVERDGRTGRGRRGRLLRRWPTRPQQPPDAARRSSTPRRWDCQSSSIARMRIWSAAA